MEENEDYLESLFTKIIKDKSQRKILKLIEKNMSPDEIIDELIKAKEG